MGSMLWIAAGILAVSMLITGVAKATRTKEQLYGSGIAHYVSGMTYIGAFPSWLIRSLGVVEVLSAVILILPGIFGIVPVLVPITATCLVVVLIGAVGIHARRWEIGRLWVPGGLLILAIFIAVGRFGPMAALRAAAAVII